MRVDLYLVRCGKAESRQKAKGMIEGGGVLLDGKPLKKPSFEVDETISHEITIQGEVLPYVSRGGLKLEGAIEAFRLDVSGLVCVDFGASTGGFTDCLLQKGAKKVFAIDSGSDQLHPSLRVDSRVVCMEKCNARYLTLADIGGTFVDLCVCDLSFISQVKIYDAVCAVLKGGGRFVSLIKPQFEAGREHLNKHGIVKDLRVHAKVKEQIVLSAKEKGLFCLGIVESPIQGGDGNIEYLALFEKRREEGENG